MPSIRRALGLGALALSLSVSPSVAARASAPRPAPQPEGMPAPKAEPAHQLRHETYRLDNGMTVILREDHARPVVVVNLWYAVGAKDEAPGRSGFAHLFEHLMFMGTERAPGSQFDEIMEAGGGWNNASTSYDRTNYFSTGPSSLLPTLLWLDADRLEDLGRMMTQEKLDKQREVVRNERRQSDENRPYGMADLALDAEMFPKGHPYHDSVIGTHEDLQAASVQDVKDFFATFYVPSNASLVVAGDFKPEEIKPLIARLFGTLPTRPAPQHGKAEPVRLESEKRLTLVDDVQLGRVTMAWHSPPVFKDGDADLDVLAGVLAGGKSSRLWNRLVRETGLCAEVSSYQGSRELQSVFQVEALCPPESSLDEVERIIDEELAKLRTQGPTQAEVERVRNAIERGKLGSLDSLLGVADQLNAYQHSLGRPDGLQWDLDRYARATPGSVRSWAQRVLDPKRRLVIRVVGEDPRARPESAAVATPFLFPRPETWTLANGLTVHLWNRPEIPIVSAQLLFPTGAAGDPAGKAGLTSLALDMLDEGTKTLSASQFADALDALGASMSANAGRQASSAGLSALARTFPRAFALWSEAVTAPAMSQEEWKRVLSLHLDGLRQRDDDPGAIAALVASRAYFGAGHPLAWPIEGVVSSCEGLELGEVARREREVVRPEGATLLVAGDIDRAALESLVNERLGAWTSSEQASPGLAIPPRAEQPGRVLIVPRPDAVQTVIRFIWPGVARKAEDRLALELANTALGGSFTSRLNQNLREEHGYTYGASSRVAAEPSLGWMSAGAAVRADVTGESLKEFLAEFKGVASGNLSEEERAKSLESEKNQRVSSTEGLDGIVGTAAALLARGETFDSFDSEFARIDSVSLAELNAAARAHVLPRRGVLVLVGDEALIRAQIKGMDLGPIEVLADPAGAGAGQAP